MNVIKNVWNHRDSVFVRMTRFFSPVSGFLSSHISGPWIHYFCSVPSACTNLWTIKEPRNLFHRIYFSSLCSQAESIPGLLKRLQIRVHAWPLVHTCLVPRLSVGTVLFLLYSSLVPASHISGPWILLFLDSAGPWLLTFLAFLDRSLRCWTAWSPFLSAN